MCRWLAYAGPPIYLDSLLFRPEHSLINQSRAAIRSLSAINADGFGVGWYEHRARPGVFKDVLPAWNDTNLRDMAEQIRSPLFFGHVRASTGTATIRANCHPFRHENWLFMHNGSIGEFERVRRELSMRIAPELYACLQGTTDSEVLFYLLITHGLMDDPARAFAKAVAEVEEVMAGAQIDEPFNMTAAVSDGAAVTALRYADHDDPPSLYYACGAQPLDLAGESAIEPGTSTLILSEPLDTEAQWNEVPAAHLLIAADGGIAVVPFEPAR